MFVLSNSSVREYETFSLHLIFGCINCVCYCGRTGLFRVRGVKVGDVLNLRESHSASARIISKIPRNAKNIKNLGENWPRYESDAPPSKETLADRTELTKEETEALLKGFSWCKVEYQKIQGWALCKYLGE
jgi:hypothetical protein